MVYTLWKCQTPLTSGGSPMWFGLTGQEVHGDQEAGGSMRDPPHKATAPIGNLYSPHHIPIPALLVDSTLNSA